MVDNKVFWKHHMHFSAFRDNIYNIIYIFRDNNIVHLLYATEERIAVYARKKKLRMKATYQKRT